MYWDYYPRAAPRPKAKPGKARKKFGETWWGKRWVELLSKYEYDQRMARGRAYARADKVTDFRIKNDCISAKVDGSRLYHVVINFNSYSGEDWKVIIERCRETPLIISKLLNGEMPEQIKECTGYSFMPESFDAECSCPDYANPCKHIAAVFYTVADEIDHDPMILFKLRGMDKEALLDKLGLTDDKAGAPRAATKKKTKARKTAVKKVAGAGRRKKTPKKPAAKKKPGKAAGRRKAQTTKKKKTRTRAGRKTLAKKVTRTKSKPQKR